MFHVEHGTEAFDALERWLNIELDPHQRTMLVRFEQWLAEEAVPAGVIGRGEVDRLFDRHIADSLVFLRGLPGDAETVADVGGGVGLPSIPLAIARPGTSFTLIDRSQKRTDLAVRAARILGLGNYTVRTIDVSMESVLHDAAVFRASLPVIQAAGVLTRCLKPGGLGLLAVSRQVDEPAIPSAPDGITFVLSCEDDGVLDSPFWLLRMHNN